MKRTIIATVMLGGLLATGISGSASAASGDNVCDTGEFCAFSASNYSGWLLESSAGVGSNAVDVTNDLTSSYRNRSQNCWKGVTIRTGLPDQTVLNAFANTAQPTASATWNNKIDHLNVRATC